MLPKVDGLSFLPIRRRITEAPIIVLSVWGEIEDKGRGLVRGIDDYIGKPFETADSIARLTSPLRRPRLARHTFVICADLTLDLEEHSVKRAERRIDSRRSLLSCSPF